MPDLSAGFDIPNPYGLRAADFDHAIDSYIAALKFLGDLASGVPEDGALIANGGNAGMLVGWRRSENFRRVYAKCRVAGDAERAAATADLPEQDESSTHDPSKPIVGQVFIPLEQMPVRRRSVFSHTSSDGVEP